MEFLAFIHWDINPEIFPGFPVRWYGLLFAAGFFIGQILMTKMFAKDGKPVEDVDTLTIYMLLATVIGARLGHTLFYEPDVYLAQPLRILKVWEGGLASHGAAIGIMVGLWLYSRTRPDQPWLWILDRVCVVVALAGGLIRMGNLMNSEIIGEPTDVPWAFVFERVDMLPRHPTQLYEALTYFAIFGLLYTLYNRLRTRMGNGFLLGIFFVLVFGSRFGWELLKENQVAFEQGMTLNMGQLLSIPLVLFGAFLIWKGWPVAKDKVNA